MVYRGVLFRVCKKLLRRSPMAASSASYIAGARVWGWPAGPCDKCVARYVCEAERNASRSAAHSSARAPSWSALHCSALMTLLPFQFPAGASPALLKALPACLVLVLVFAGHLRVTKLYEYMRVAHSNKRAPRCQSCPYTLMWHRACEDGRCPCYNTQAGIASPSGRGGENLD